MIGRVSYQGQLRVVIISKTRRRQLLLLLDKQYLIYLCSVFCDRFKVCQGPYDKALIRAWEDWDDKHGSENDHPKDFPEKQVPCFDFVVDGLLFISNLNLQCYLQ